MSETSGSDAMMSDDDVTAAFHERQAADQSRGKTPTLHEYLAIWPDHQTLVAREFLAKTTGVQGGSMASPSAADRLGPYVIEKELGRGGQGAVYLATDTRLKRRVALKVLRGLGPDAETGIRRFRREAEVASRLDHPGICGVLDAGVEGGVPYIAMPYVEGESLAAWIARKKSAATTASNATQDIAFDSISKETDGDPASEAVPVEVSSLSRHDVREVLGLIEKTATALHAAHEAGILHRDIKPGNIMLSKIGQPVILDFGLARLDDAAEDAPSLTKSGDLFGTPAYMSPEQIAGTRIALDRRSDVYSLGVTLYECLTLRRPFEGATREALYQAILSKSPTDARKVNRAISRDLRVVIDTAIERDRDRRYAGADALARDLAAVLDGRPIEARPVGPVGRLARWSKREPAKAVLLAVLLAVLPTLAVLITAHVKDRTQVEAARRTAIEHQRDELLAEASYEATEGDARRALDLYAQALDLEGAAPEAVGGMALVHLNLGNPGDALRLLERHHALLGNGAAAHLLRAAALSASGRQAEADALHAASPPPRSSFEYHLLAERELQRAERGERSALPVALDHVTRAIMLSPTPKLSHFTLRAHIVGHLGDAAAAAATAEVLDANWPHSAMARSWIGYALLRTGDRRLLEAALAATREAVRLRPDIARHHEYLGYALADVGRVDEALAAHREAVRLRPDIGVGYVNLGAALHDQGHLDEAMETFKRGIAAAPTEATIRGNLGATLHAQGDFDAALAALRQAISLRPDDPAIHFNLGNCLLSLGEPEKAVAAYRTALRLDPEAPGHYVNLGSALNALGYRDDAIAACRDAIRMNPDNAAAFCNLSLRLEESGRFRESLEMIRRGHDLGSRQSGWAHPSGDWVAHAERLVEREAVLEGQVARCLAAGTDPEDIKDLVDLARVAHSQGHHLAAARWYFQAFDEVPDLASRPLVDMRRSAARAAVAAAMIPDTETPGLDDGARATWRGRALEWLADEIATLREGIAQRRLPDRDLRIALLAMTGAAEFAPLRDARLMSVLPAAEAGRWRATWSTIDELLRSLDQE